MFIPDPDFYPSITLIVFTSVAEPGCLSRIPDPDFIYPPYHFHFLPPVLRSRDVYPPDPGSWFYPSRIPDLGSRIPDPTTETKEEGKKFVALLFFGSHKYYKIKNNLILNRYREKIEIRDPQKPIPDPGSRSQKRTGSRIRIRNTVFQFPVMLLQLGFPCRSNWCAPIHHDDFLLCIPHTKDDWCPFLFETLSALKVHCFFKWYRYKCWGFCCLSSSPVKTQLLHGTFLEALRKIKLLFIARAGFKIIFLGCL